MTTKEISELTGIPEETLARNAKALLSKYFNEDGSPKAKRKIDDSMTVIELAKVAGCARNTVMATVKRLFPELVQNGKETRIGQKAALKIMAQLPKRNMVQEPNQNVIGQPNQKSIGDGQNLNLPDTPFQDPSALKESIEEVRQMVERLGLALPVLIGNAVQQINQNAQNARLMLPATPGADLPEWVKNIAVNAELKKQKKAKLEAKTPKLFK